jgi:hypothetical protein
MARSIAIGSDNEYRKLNKTVVTAKRGGNIRIARQLVPGTLRVFATVRGSAISMYADDTR